MKCFETKMEIFSRFTACLQTSWDIYIYTHTLVSCCGSILPKCRTNRVKHSFIPAAIGLLNSWAYFAFSHAEAGSNNSFQQTIVQAKHVGHKMAASTRRQMADQQDFRASDSTPLTANSSLSQQCELWPKSKRGLKHHKGALGRQPCGSPPRDERRDGNMWCLLSSELDCHVLLPILRSCFSVHWSF